MSNNNDSGGAVECLFILGFFIWVYVFMTETLWLENWQCTKWGDSDITYSGSDERDCTQYTYKDRIKKVTPQGKSKVEK